MTITAMLPAGQLAALDQAIARWRDACNAFAHRAGTYDAVRAADAQMRRAGLDETTGLVTLPVGAVTFADVRADGARMTAVNGSLLGGEVWTWWSGRALRFGGEGITYRDPWQLVQVRA